MRVAFIGDSFSAYEQTGQQKNSWTYLLAKHFPQHQYYNYALGGRGFDYYRIAMLDAKLRNIDVIIINKTFYQRLFFHYGDREGLFEVEYNVDDNYTNLVYNDIVWYSTHGSESNFCTKESAPDSVKQAYVICQQAQSTSTGYQNYNALWYDRLEDLYNFKHIVKLELLNNPNGEQRDSAYQQLNKAFGVYQEIQRQLFENKRSIYGFMDDKLRMKLDDKLRMKLLVNNDLVISAEDDHWSPKANKWVFENYILPRVVDILAE